MADSIRTRFTDRFSIRYPIAQAGMAFAGWSPPLAIAVARAAASGPSAQACCRRTWCAAWCRR